MIEKIIFVCSGNTCRSPIAEYAMKQLFETWKMEEESIAVETSRKEEKSLTIAPLQKEMGTTPGMEEDLADEPMVKVAEKRTRTVNLDSAEKKTDEADQEEREKLFSPQEKMPVIFSCGLFTYHGSPASHGSVQKGKLLYNLDLSEHQSRPFSPYMIDENTLVFCMTQNQVDYIRSYYPACAEQTDTLLHAAYGRQEDVKDPYGLGHPSYEEMIHTVYHACEALLKKWKSKNT